MPGMQALKRTAAFSHFTVVSLSFAGRDWYQTHPLRAHESYLLTGQALLLTYHQPDLLKFSKKDLKESHRGITEMSSSQIMPSVELRCFQTEEIISFCCLYNMWWQTYTYNSQRYIYIMNCIGFQAVNVKAQLHQTLQILCSRLLECALHPIMLCAATSKITITF